MEKVLEKRIKGTDGKKSISRSVGQEAKVTEIAAIPGNNVSLTIDIDLQRVAEEALEKGLDKVVKEVYIYSLYLNKEIKIRHWARPAIPRRGCH